MWEKTALQILGFSVSMSIQISIQNKRIQRNPIFSFPSYFVKTYYKQLNNQKLISWHKKHCTFYATREFTKRIREMSSQLFVTLCILSTYPSAHNQLRRHLPNFFCEFPCIKVPSNNSIHISLLPIHKIWKICTTYVQTIIQKTGLQNIEINKQDFHQEYFGFVVETKIFVQCAGSKVLFLLSYWLK